MARIKNGRDYKHLSPGTIPVYGSGGIMTHVDKASFDGPSVLLPRKGSISNVFYVDEPFWNVDTIYYTKINDQLVIPKFFYYVLANAHIEKLNTSNAARPALTQAVLNKVRIPVPPLEVQREIVRILDGFTKLEAELEAELEARRKQYAFYRDQLLTFTPERGRTKWQELGRLCSFRRGSGIQKKDFAKQGLPALHYGQIYTQFGITATAPVSFVNESAYKKAKLVEPGEVVLADTSENVEDLGKSVAWLGTEPAALSNHTIIMATTLDPKFLSYFLNSGHFQRQKTRYVFGTKVKTISVASLAKIQIPVPPLEEQRRIVAILDKFDALVNDISSGLPAEIEARRKQYEHYRDRLLTFPELNG
ncbi:restriction endonuclease subunit S [Trueperella pyogenes]